MSVEVTEEELSRLHQKITDLNDETFDLRAEVTKLIESNSTLSTELERQTKTLVASQVAKETGGDDDKKKSRFTRFVDKVKDTKDMVEMQAEIDVLQAQVAQHESEAVRLQAMEMNTRHLQTFARESQLSISTLEESERKLKKQLAGMKDLVESKPELHDASAVADTKMQLDDALHSLAQKEADLTESAQRLVTTDEANLDLRRTVTQLQMDVDAWKKRSSSLDTALLEIERLTQAGDCLKIDSQAWKEQCQHLQKDLLERAETFEEKKREAQKQAENIASLQSQLEALSNEKALREQAELSLSDMSLKLQTVTSEAADNEKECARFDEVQSKATSLQNNVSSMKEALKIRDATIAKERVQNDALTERLKCETEKAAEADTLRAVIAERDIRDLVSACVDDAAFLAEQQTAAKLPALEESLSSCKAEAAYLQERAKEFDQKLSDLRSEHKIVTRKKDNLIRELQSQLKNAEKEQLNHEKQQKTLSAEASVLRSSSSVNSLSQSVDGLSLQDVPAAPLATPELAALQKEEIHLIQKVASLTQKAWQLEEDKRNQQLTIKQLQEDNDKKNVVIGHWLSGPAAEQLLAKKGKLLTKQKQSTTAWLTGMGASVKQQDINATLQKVVQDTIAENIVLNEKLQEAEQKLK